MNRLLLFIQLTILTTLTCQAQSADSLYKAAFSLYEKGEFKKALTCIEPALLSDSTNLDYLILKGNSEAGAEELNHAFTTYSQIIQLYPKKSVGYNQRGLLLKRILKTEAAIQDFTKGLTIEISDSNRLTLLVNRGASRINIRDFQGAYDDFSEALKIDSLNIGTLNNIAAVCDEIGKGDLTLFYLKKILKIDSTFIGAYANIGFKYQDMGDFKTAITYYNKVLELDKNQPLGYSNRSYNYYKLGDYLNALADINISIKLYPANSYAFRVRALIYLALNDRQKACADINEALELGFTKMYGDEVEKLKLQNCKSNSR